MKMFKQWVWTAFFLCLTLSIFAFNYGEALQKAIFFYEAQQAGPLPAWNRVEWRGDATMEDTVLGGLYDAGDHVKFNLPMAYTASVLGWSVYEYKSAFVASGQYTHIENNIKFILDYLLDCWDGTNYIFQVGKGSYDHSWWGPVEVIHKESQAGNRPVEVASSGISCVMAQSAAALAIGYELFGNSAYLQAAEQLFAKAAADESDATYKASDASAFYNSWSGPVDELMWAATWLHIATGQSSYLDKAESYVPKLNRQPNSTLNVIEYKWGHCWDDSHYGAMILLARLTGKQLYSDYAEMHLDWWTPGGYNGESVDYTPGGLAHLTSWGALRHSTTSALLAFVYSDWVSDPVKKAKYKNWAESQIDYALGDNPRNSSYEIGFGTNAPEHPHHRTAHGSWADSQDVPPNHRHTLFGALVGGPNGSDGYQDDIGDYVMNEVACDYNAGFVGGLAKMYGLYGGNPLGNFPQPEAKEDEFFVEASSSSNSVNSLEIKLQGNNRSAWPARLIKDFRMRYYLDLSEVIASGYSADSVTVGTVYVEFPVTVSPLIHYGGTVYYAEIKYNDGTSIYPGGMSEFAGEVQMRLTAPTGAAWDTSNDWSFQGIGKDMVKTSYITLYDGTGKIWGEEPSGIPTLPPGTTPTPTVPPVEGPVKVQYFCGEPAVSAAQIKPRLNIVNLSNSPVALSELKIRYYFTKEGTTEELFQIDYAQIGSTNISGTLYDGYVEIQFLSGAGTLAKNGQTGEIQGRINKSDWSAYDQSNDYSFGPAVASFTDYSKITIYRNGELIWGTPPGGTPATPTPVPPTPTPTPTPAPSPTPTAPEQLLGDVNGSGLVDIIDALMTAQYYVGLNPPKFNTAVGDVNGSGVIDIVDALMIAQYYVGLITEF